MGWNNLHLTVMPYGKAMVSSLPDAAEIQSKILFEILHRNRQTEYGLKHGFGKISSIDEYQSSVPVVSYDDITEHINSMVNGEIDVLCSEEILAFERTGGSSAGSKLIPYTASSLDSFGVALKTWLCDLLDHRPGIKSGSAYWSVSPALKSRKCLTSANIPIGLASDAEYFGASLAQDLLSTLVTPMTLSAVDNFEDWRYLTVRYLLAAEDLAFISVWSPTYIIDLLDYLKSDYQRLASDIASGSISIDNESLCDSHKALMISDRDRSEIVKKACSQDKIDISVLWPQLDTLSCWLSAASGRYKLKLEEYFPDVYIQPKGLLATEGVISIPMCRYSADLLAITSGFYEFIDSSGNVLLANELLQDEVYHVLITNHSGLYRYDIGDQVRVTGKADSVPLLEFIGRSHSDIDICGEKLSEAFVYRAMQSIKGFALLMPSYQERKYYLFFDSEEHNLSSGNNAAERLDMQLQKNPQYRYSRKIEQLPVIEPVLVNHPWQLYQTHEIVRGRILGDIKPVTLLDDALLFHVMLENAVTSEIKGSACVDFR